MAAHTPAAGEAWRRGPSGAHTNTPRGSHEERRAAHLAAHKHAAGNVQYGLVPWAAQRSSAGSTPHAGIGPPKKPPTHPPDARTFAFSSASSPCAPSRRRRCLP